MRTDPQHKDKARQLQKARDQYVAQVNKLLDSEEAGKLFKKQLFRLDAMIGTLTEDRDLIATLYGEDVVGQTMVHKFNQQIRARERAKEAILTDREAVRTHLERSLQDIVRAFDDPAISPIGEDGTLKARFVTRVRRSDRGGTVEDVEARYRPIDEWLERGFGHVFTEQNAEERAYQLALVPLPIREAQWRFMLSLSDALYDVGLNAPHKKSIAPEHLAVLSYLFARLSNHERGIMNPHMPELYQARHNPAIHSMHVVALLDKVFRDAADNLRSVKGLEPKDVDRLHAKLRKMRAQAMLGAMVHDMGEMDGEPKEGKTVIGRSEAERVAIKKASDDMEVWAFHKYLDKSRKRLGKEYQQKHDGDARWQELRSVYEGAFNLVEHNEQFLGRMIKVVERIQSQHDYWRFNSKGGGTPLAEAQPDELAFSMSYVSDRLYDAPYHAQEPGKNALLYLIHSGKNRDEIILFGALYQAVESEYRRYFPGQLRAYGVAGADRTDFLGKTPLFQIGAARTV